MKKFIFLMLVLGIFGTSKTAQAQCVDSSLINLNAICPAIWLPVCGCDGVTYSNDCSAINYGGVTSYTPGECVVGNICSAELSDSLLSTFDLMLAATPTSGQAPFTYSWNIFGAGGGFLSPIYSSAANDTVLISSVDLFNNFSCVVIEMCMTDALGCQTCVSDTSFGSGDFMCFSAFTWQETNIDGVFDIVQTNNMPPAFLFAGMNFFWGNPQEQTEVFPGQPFLITYSPEAYNADGYDFQACMATYLTSGICVDCQTLHASAGAFTVGNLDPQNEPFKVFPNPTSGAFAIETNGVNLGSEFALFDGIGRKIRTGTLQETRTMVAVSGLSAGLYTLKIEGQNGQTSAVKLVVK